MLLKNKSRKRISENITLLRVRDRLGLKRLDAIPPENVSNELVEALCLTLPLFWPDEAL